MKFSKITLSEWRQFKNINIEFHDKISIITGTNGAGKSTILKVLAEHFNWKSNFLAVPLYNEITGNYIFKNSSGISMKKKIQRAKEVCVIGNITYSDDSISELLIEDQPNRINYEVTIEPLNKKIKGLYIHSHRASTNYTQISQIPTKVLTAEESYEKHHDAYKRHLEDVSFNASPTKMIKESLISMAALGIGNSHIKKNKKTEALFFEFIDILKKVLPLEIGFTDINIKIPDVVLQTSSGEFIMDSTSGGIMSIIDMAWQILLYSQDKDEFVVIIDEPENHLHPSMQRSLINDFVTAFPKAQFIIVTHSPFIVSSIKDSHVYALKYENFKDLEDSEKVVKKVVSHKLDLDQKAATAHEVLREVLGVPVTLPQWAEDDLQRICSNFSASDITPDGLTRLHTELEQAGLGEFYPEALNKVVASNFHD